MIRPLPFSDLLPFSGDVGVAILPDSARPVGKFRPLTMVVTSPSGERRSSVPDAGSRPFVANCSAYAEPSPNAMPMVVSRRSRRPTTDRRGSDIHFG